MPRHIASLILAASYAANASSVAGGHSTPASIASAVAELSSSNITARIRFTELMKGRGQLGVEIRAQGLKPGVSYPYHIHVDPVPASGNCTATGGHFDPYKVNTNPKTYKCDPKNAAKTCELGDLAGRHGNITGNASGCYTAQYTDALISLAGPNSIVGHSIVIHAPDNKRIACANINAKRKRQCAEA